MCKTLYLVIPCFNEEDVLPETSKQLEIKIKKMIEQKLVDENSKVVFVDDGSKDSTWNIIKQLHAENELFSGLSLAHNSGEQNAYLAGMMTVKEYADMVITMDADLQDDIDAIDKMVAEYYKGNDIVYGVRSVRRKESFFRKYSAKVFYKIMKIMGTELIPNHSQYRLMSRRAIEELSRYSEVNLFLPALIPLLGFKNSFVYYERKERYAGKSKYSVGKLFLLASEAVTSFSLKPIQMINVLAFVAFCFSVFGMAAMAVKEVKFGIVPSWLIIFTSVWAIGALQLIATKIIGEYIGKAYKEVKRRPRYIISESFLDEKSNNNK